MHRLYLALATALALTACEGGTVVIRETGLEETCAEHDPASLPAIVDGEIQSFEGWGFVGEMWVTRTDISEEACMACEDGRCMQPEPFGSDRLYLGVWTDDSAGEWCDAYGEVACGPVFNDGRCGFVMQASYSCAAEGRPLLVDGIARTADPRAEPWSRQAVELEPVPAAERLQVHARWVQAGLTEHASVAAFSRFSLQLMALGAPPDLLADASRAALDEVHHAEACFAIAAALGGPVGPGPLSCDDLLAAPELSPEAVLRGTFDEGCVGETVAAALARAGAESASDPEIARVLHRIADDETRHAALAWRTVQWLVTTYPNLRPVLAQLVARCALAPSRQADLPQHGLPGGARADAIGRDALVRVVGPLARDVLRATDATSPAASAG